MWRGCGGTPARCRTRCGAGRWSLPAPSTSWASTRVGAWSRSRPRPSATSRCAPSAAGIDAVGTVRAPWVGICRRCAVPVSGDLEIAVSERFGDGPLGEDDLYPIVDDTIDLGPLVRDAIVLELPMAPLCREGCRGLCPQCGADRNEADCGCVAPVDPRWANLDVLR